MGLQSSSSTFDLEMGESLTRMSQKEGTPSNAYSNCGPPMLEIPVSGKRIVSFKKGTKILLIQGNDVPNL